MRGQASTEIILLVEIQNNKIWHMDENNLVELIYKKMTTLSSNDIKEKI